MHFQVRHEPPRLFLSDPTMYTRRIANIRVNRVFYYPGARYDTALLVQAFCNILVQAALLKVALDYRPSPSSKGGEAATPFAGAQDGLSGAPRPYKFWQWRSSRPYVFLLFHVSRHSS